MCLLFLSPVIPDHSRMRQLLYQRNDVFATMRLNINVHSIDLYSNIRCIFVHAINACKTLGNSGTRAERYQTVCRHISKKTPAYTRSLFFYISKRACVCHRSDFFDTMYIFNRNSLTYRRNVLKNISIEMNNNWKFS